jgi:parallel beta-helix repeat protein
VRTIKTILLFTLVIIVSACQEKSVKIKEISITTSLSEFDFIYKNPYADTSINVVVKYNGKSDSAMLRIRGSSSRDYEKKSLKLSFKNKSLFGVKKINLNSEYTDKSYIRQALSTKFFQKSGQACFNSEHVVLNLNDTFFGIYLLVENMDKSFLKRNQLDEKGNLYKATHDGACMSNYDNVKEKWEKKTNEKEPWNDLEKLIKEVNTVPSKEFHFWAKHRFDYDELINYVAMNMLIANGSTYYHNYYLYHDLKTDKWKFLPWDLDKTISYYSWMPYQHNKTSSNWESDNPLIEKLLINDTSYNDIIKKIHILEKNVFSSSYINHLIDSLENVLKPYIELDTTDKITSVDEWQKQLKTENNFLKEHPKKIIEQLENYPRGFEVERTQELVFPEFTLTWNKSNHPKKLPISYQIFISEDFDFADSITLKHILKDTSFQLPKTLEINKKYFWKVVATDGKNETEGFNTKNFFTVKLPSVISAKMPENLTKNNSPYIINNSVTIDKTTTTRIENGTIIYLINDALIEAHGNIACQGAKFISLKKSGNLNYIHIYNTSTSLFENTLFKDVSIPIHGANVRFDKCEFISEKRSLFDKERKSMVWSNHGEVIIENSYMAGNGTGEGINLNYSKSRISNNFICAIPDAIELIDVSDGIIEDNTVIGSQDDAIDLNGCNGVMIKNNTLIYNADKGVSIGAEQYGKSTNISALNNKISFNKIGISVKDSSDIILQNNSITNNKIGVEAYKKLEHYKVGGKATIQKNLIENNSEDFKNDRWSVIER